jgi:hypothetical protein
MGTHDNRGANPAPLAQDVRSANPNGSDKGSDASDGVRPSVGQMVTTVALHVFVYRGCDWVVAANVEDAWACLEEQHGEGFRDDEDLEGNAGWERLADDSELVIWCDDDGDIAEIDEDGAGPITRTCADWVARSGRGFLASTES